MNSQKKKQTTCLKFTAYLSVIILIIPSIFGVTYPKNYRYYNTREDYPVKRLRQRAYTQSEVDNSWIKVPWTHGGHYYHNTLTREDRDAVPSCLENL
tara:strand:+ start:671 stop:961 length:291 start_codon:yes stop_codon:yes gene_type:complete